jgi:hypothetical protein
MKDTPGNPCNLLLAQLTTTWHGPTLICNFNVAMNMYFLLYTEWAAADEDFSTRRPAAAAANGQT